MIATGVAISGQLARLDVRWPRRSHLFRTTGIGIYEKSYSPESTANAQLPIRNLLAANERQLAAITLEGNSLHTATRPKFPDHQFAITLESANSGE